VHLGLALLPLTSLVACKGDGARAVREEQPRPPRTGEPAPLPRPQERAVLVPWAGDPVDPAQDYLGGALGDRAAWRNLAGLVVLDGTLYLAEGRDHTIRAAASQGDAWTQANLRAFAGRRAMASGWTGQPGAQGDGFLTSPAALTSLGGDLIVAEPSRHCLKRVPRDNPAAWTLFAGRPGVAGRQGGAAADTRLGTPAALASDGATQVFVADAQHGLIWRFTPEGAGEAITAPGTFQNPRGLALGADGRLYVADRGNHAIYRLTRASSGAWGAPERVAGHPGQAGFQDGGVDAGLLREPMGLAFDAFGRLLVADAGNHALRSLNLDGQAPVLATLAGALPGTPDAGRPGRVDGGIPEARFNRPTHLALGQAGEIFVVEEPAGGTSTLRFLTAGRVETLGRRDLGTALDLPGAGVFGPLGALAATQDGRILAADAQARVLRVLRGRTLEAPIPFPDGVEGPIHRLAVTSDGAIRLLPGAGAPVLLTRDGTPWAPEGREPVLDLAAHPEAPGARVAELRAREGGYRITVRLPRGEAQVDLDARPQAMALDARNNLLLALPGPDGGLLLERHLSAADGYRRDTKPAVRLALGRHAGAGAILALAALDGDRVLLADSANAMVWEANVADGTYRAWAGAFPHVESRRAPRDAGDPLGALAGMVLAPGGEVYLATGEGLLRTSPGGARRGPAPDPDKGPHPRGPEHPRQDPGPDPALEDLRAERNRALANLTASRDRGRALEARLAQLQADLQAREREARAARGNAGHEAAHVADLRGRLERLRTERNEHEATARTLAARLARLEGELRAAQAQTERMAALQADLQALQAGRDAALARAQEATRQAEGEASRAQTLQAERDQQRTAAEASQAEVRSLATRIAQLQTELQDRQAGLDAARRAAEGGRADIQGLQAQLQALQAERDAKVAAEQARAAASEQRLTELEAGQREREQQASARLQDLIAQHQKELALMRERLGAEGEAAQARLQTRLAEAEAVLQAVLQGSDADRMREAEAHAQRVRDLEAQVRDMEGRLAQARLEGRQAQDEAGVHLAELQRALDQAQAEAEVLRSSAWETGKAALARIEALKTEAQALGLQRALAEAEATRSGMTLRAEVRRLRALAAERDQALQRLAPMLRDLKDDAASRGGEARLQALQAENATLREHLSRFDVRSSASSADGAQVEALGAQSARIDLLRQTLHGQLAGTQALAASPRAEARASALVGLAPGPRGLLYTLDAQGRLVRHTAQGKKLLAVREGDRDQTLWKVATLDARGTLLALTVDGRVLVSSDAGETWTPMNRPYGKVLDLAASPHAKTAQAAFLLEAGLGYTVALRREGQPEALVRGTGVPGPMALGADGTFALVVDPGAAQPRLRVYRPAPEGCVLSREIVLHAALPMTISRDGIVRPRIRALAFSPSGPLVLADAANRTLWRLAADGRLAACMPPGLLREAFHTSVPASDPLPEPLDLGFDASGHLWVLHGSGIGSLRLASAPAPFQEGRKAPLPLGTVLRAAQRSSLDAQGRPWVLTPQGEVARWDTGRQGLVTETRLPKGALDLAASPWRDQVAALHRDPRGGFRLSLAGPGGVQVLGLRHRPSAMALLPDGRVVLAFRAPRGWAQVVALRPTPSGLAWDPSLDLAFGPDPRALGSASQAPAVNLTALAADARGNLYLLDAPRGILYRALQDRTVEILASGLQARGQKRLTPHFLQVDAQGGLLLARAGDPFVLPLEPDAHRPDLGRLAHIRQQPDGLLPRSARKRAQLSRAFRTLPQAPALRTRPAQEDRTPMIDTARTGPTLAEPASRLTSLLPLAEGRLVILDDQGRLRIQDARGQATPFPVETGPGALRVATIARGRRGSLLIRSQNGRQFAWNPAQPAGLAEQPDGVLGMAQAVTAQGANYAVLQRMVDAPHPFQIAVNRWIGGSALPGAVLKLEAQPLAWGLDGAGTLVVLRNLRSAPSQAPQRVLERYGTPKQRPTEYQRLGTATHIHGATLRAPITAHPVATDLAVTPQGRILVADPANRTIWHLDPATGTLTPWAGPERLEAARRQALPETKAPLQGPNGLAALGDQGIFATLADGVVWLPFLEEGDGPTRAHEAEDLESKRPASLEEKHAAPDATRASASEGLDAPGTAPGQPLASTRAEREGTHWVATLHPAGGETGAFQVRIATTTPVGATEAIIDMPDQPLGLALDNRGTLVLLRANAKGDRLLSVHTPLPHRPGLYRCGQVAWIERGAAGVEHFGPMVLAANEQGEVVLGCSDNRVVWQVNPATGKVTRLAGPAELDAAAQETFQGPRAVASRPDGTWILTHDRGTVTLPRLAEAARQAEKAAESARLSEALASRQDPRPGAAGTGPAPKAAATQEGPLTAIPEETKGTTERGTTAEELAQILREADEAADYAESIASAFTPSEAEPEQGPATPERPTSPAQAQRTGSPSQGPDWRLFTNGKSLSPHLGRHLKR